ncbi:carboxymuconolactone decarboxylase family protein [Falsiroseomonas sp. HC035]|uniref:carboxymuconolactone decarboxylase family protein n=1 Tax=Falsiroseomonas sp. HC035 TaxID=3390999 RepID=UPI003D321081
MGGDGRLDRRTRALIGLAVAAALRSDAQLLRWVAEARCAGTPRDEVAAALLAAVPAAGAEVLAMLAPALRAFDEPYQRGQD